MGLVTIAAISQDSLIHLILDKRIGDIILQDRQLITGVSLKNDINMAEKHARYLAA